LNPTLPEPYETGVLRLIVGAQPIFVCGLSVILGFLAESCLLTRKLQVSLLSNQVSLELEDADSDFPYLSNETDQQT
jgi:hypothetical protein